MARSHTPSLRAAGLLLLLTIAGPWLLSILLTGDPFTFGTSPEKQASEVAPVYFGMTLVLVGVTLVFGWRTATGLRRPVSFTAGKAGLYGAFVLAATGLLWTGSADLSLTATGFLAVNALLTAVSEELLTRGILLAALLPRVGLVRAVLLSMLIFAGLHLINTGLQGEPNVQQFVSSGLGTLPLIALRLRTGSLLLPILFHTAFNFLADAARFADVQASGLLIQGLTVAVLFVWGVRVLFDLRRAERAPAAE